MFLFCFVILAFTILRYILFIICMTIYITWFWCMSGICIYTTFNYTGMVIINAIYMYIRHTCLIIIFWKAVLVYINNLSTLIILVSLKLSFEGSSLNLIYNQVNYALKMYLSKFLLCKDFLWEYLGRWHNFFGLYSPTRNDLYSKRSNNYAIKHLKKLLISMLSRLTDTVDCHWVYYTYNLLIFTSKYIINALYICLISPILINM